ncbi:uncharacterized protein METZ01_LOCUS475169, partial [marine metagenome]
MGGLADIDGALTVAGATTMNGNVTLGNATGDAITVTGTVGSDVLMNQSGGSKPDIQMKNTNADASGGRLHFVKESASPADNDALGSVAWTGDDDGGNATQFAEISGISTDITNGTEDGAIVLNATVGGTATDILTVGATAAGGMQMRAHGSYTTTDNADLATKYYVDNTVSAAGDTIEKLNSSVIVTDTGSDGKITFTNDGVEVGSFDSAVFNAGTLNITGSTLASTGADVTVGDNLIV